MTVPLDLTFKPSAEIETGEHMAHFSAERLHLADVLLTGTIRRDQSRFQTAIARPRVMICCLA